MNINERTLKILDTVERTHLMPCTRVTYLGHGDNGLALALIASPDADYFVNLDYDVENFQDKKHRTHKRYFLRFAAQSDPTVIVSCAHGAWLLGPTGATLENFFRLPQPGRQDSVMLPALPS